MGGLWILSSALLSAHASWATAGAPPQPAPAFGTHAIQDDAEEAARFFVLSASCARCHNAVETSTALWTDTGEDASPIGTWRASVMAQSFYDPYWRAQIERELALAPNEDERAARNALCTRCHAPAAVHEARFEGLAPPTLAQLDQDPAAAEGVTCTICHRMTAEGLGTPATFDGHLPLDFANRLYGPYPDPVPGPMLAMSGYEIHFGAHMVESALCATCHTLETSHGSGEAAGHFLEQSPYLEWRNSAFTHERGITDTSRSCQDCHMPVMGNMALAHNPAGGNFPFLSERPNVRSHAIVGGNALLLDMLAAGRDELGVAAPADELKAMATETRRYLREEAAHIEIGEVQWSTDQLEFVVFVENLTGHKLPTGYPSRRVWLEVQVQTGERTWFASGVPDAEGRIVPRGEGLRLPHRDRITSSDQVQVYEMIALDEEGQPTTQLSSMRKRLKDNRLLPLGWIPEGPHGEETAPVGLGDDANFVGSLDQVTFALEIPASVRNAGRPQVQARLLYQSIPPAWADDHRDVEDSPASVRFLRLYDAAKTRYEVLAEARKLVR